ncbi:MAG: hypothetical protein LBC31_10880 [Treponema sp.]|jgi:hypothetical protein|nr:hypothetical protein [Treponema sp.]
MHKRVPALLAGLLILLAACTNPMVEYLLREEGETLPIGEKEDVSPVAALWDTLAGEYVWYYSLQAAVDDAAGTSAASPEDIYIRRDVSRPLAMGAAGIELLSGKHIRLTPYLAETSSVTVQRWQAGTDLFTVRNGASLAIGQGITIRGRGIAADAPGVYVETGGVFTMSGNARVVDTDVYLKNGAMITVDGGLGSNPAARITPEVYGSTIQVVNGTAADIDGNNEKFDVTPEPTPPGWQSSRHWRVDNYGCLLHVVARRTAGGVSTYYPDTASLSDAVALQNAFTAATGSFFPEVLDEVTLLSNIDLDVADQIVVDTGHYTRLTVPPGASYIIRRNAGPAAAAIFLINYGSILELETPGNSSLIIDGGAVWSGDPNTVSGWSNTGFTSSSALVYVFGISDSPGQFRLKNGVVLQNNDRTFGNGAAVQASGGLFHMTGGVIKNNRTTGNGGALYLEGVTLSSGTPPSHTIVSGLITGNDAGLGGGGIALDRLGNVILTMDGGEITGNRARGIDTSFSSALGYGGGIFIANNADVNKTTFIMRGGWISDNTSIGRPYGHGIVIDHIKASYPPVFKIGGMARIVNNDVNLHYHSVDLYNPVLIDVTGFAPGHSPGPVEITMDTYVFSSCQVLAGSFNSAHFTASWPHTIGADGKLYP